MKVLLKFCTSDNIAVGFPSRCRKPLVFKHATSVSIHSERYNPQVNEYPTSTRADHYCASGHSSGPPPTGLKEYSFKEQQYQGFTASPLLSSAIISSRASWKRGLLPVTMFRICRGREFRYRPSSWLNFAQSGRICYREESSVRFFLLKGLQICLLAQLGEELPVR